MNYMKPICTIVMSAFAVHVFADIVATSGSIQQIDPTVGGDIRRGSIFEADSVGNAFNEHRFATVSPALTGVNTPLSIQNGELLEGAVVHSHFLFTDPANNNNNNTITTGAGSIVFAHSILAVVFDCNAVDATDERFGLPDVTYENSNLPNFCHGAGGYPTGDQWSISGNTFDLIQFTTHGGRYDSVRILTDACEGSNDQDSDGIVDEFDNCVLKHNPDQLDSNGDGIGNVCDADLNGDRIVNVLDLGLFRLVFFTSDDDADFNGDNIVNVIDLGILRSQFFDPPGPSCMASSAP